MEIKHKSVKKENIIVFDRRIRNLTSIPFHREEFLKNAKKNFEMSPST